ncbi:MAG TPA: hypothetical protein VNT52_17535, partial [Acidimicrobiales bacterium]|nr:hypothetical protein [Acidimicrobiales bacterium]
MSRFLVTSARAVCVSTTTQSEEGGGSGFAHLARVVRLHRRVAWRMRERPDVLRGGGFAVREVVLDHVGRSVRVRVLQLPQLALRPESFPGFLAHHRGGTDEVSARLRGSVALPADRCCLLALQSVRQLFREVSNDAACFL